MLVVPGLPSTMLLQYALPPEKLRSRIMALIFVQLGSMMVSLGEEGEAAETVNGQLILMNRQAMMTVAKILILIFQHPFMLFRPLY